MHKLEKVIVHRLEKEIAQIREGNDISAREGIAIKLRNRFEYPKTSVPNASISMI